jgi:hypothetical protein
MPYNGRGAGLRAARTRVHHMSYGSHADLMLLTPKCPSRFMGSERARALLAHETLSDHPFLQLIRTRELMYEIFCQMYKFTLPAGSRAVDRQRSVASAQGPILIDNADDDQDEGRQADEIDPMAGLERRVDCAQRKPVYREQRESHGEEDKNPVTRDLPVT